MLEAEAKRREHQKELEKQAREDAAKRFLKGNKKDVGVTKTRDIESYRDVSQFPKDIVKNKVIT